MKVSDSLNSISKISSIEHSLHPVMNGNQSILNEFGLHTSIDNYDEKDLYLKLKHLILIGDYSGAYELNSAIQKKKKSAKAEEVEKACMELSENVQNIRRAHDIQYEEFCSQWDLYMTDYSAVAYSALEKLKMEHLIQLKHLTDELNSKYRDNSRVRYSKYILDLRHREDALAKQGEYDDAEIIQNKIKSLCLKEEAIHLEKNEAIIKNKIESLKQKQSMELQSFLKRVESERSKFICKLSKDSWRFVRRNRMILCDISKKGLKSIQNIKYQSPEFTKNG